jgi:hypothetical protein
MIDSVVIDPEYEGYEAIIKEWIMTLCHREGIVVYREQVTFHRVGKKSPAHELAYRTFKKRLIADQIIRAEDILRKFGE